MNRCKFQIKYRIFMTSLLICLSLLGMCSCVKPGTKTSGTELPTDDRQVWISVSKQAYPLPAGYVIDGMARMGNRLLIAGTREDQIAFAVATYNDLQTEAANITDIHSLESTAEGQVCAVTAGEDGLFYVLYTTAAENESPREYMLLLLNAEGTFAGTRTIRVDQPQAERLNALALTGTGTLIACSHTFYCIWPNDSAQAQVFYDEHVRYYGLQNSKAGVLAAAFFDEPAHHGFRTIQIAEDGSYTHLGGDIASLSNTQSLDGVPLINDGSTLYSFDFENGMKKELLLWNERMLRSDLTTVVQLGEKAFAYSFRGDDTLCLTSSVPQQLNRRQTVRVAVLDGADTSLLKSLNASDSVYYYEMVEYTGEREEVSIALLSDIVSGNGPDLILHCGCLDTDSRFFEDLYPYIDADETLSREDFIPNLLSALEARGELHEIWSGTSVYCYSACVSDVGNGKGLSMDRLSEIAKQKDGCESVFNFGFHGESFLYWVGLYGCEDYIDKDTGTCHFNDPAFAEMLSWSKSDGPSGYQEERTQSLLWQEGLSRGEQLKIAAQAWGEPFVLLGSPLASDSGSYFYSSNPLSPAIAIPVNSSCKEGAWAYIRTQLTVEEQLRYEYSDFPVIMEAFERRENKPTAPKKYYEMLVELLKNTHRAAKFSDYTMQRIIVDSGMAYVHGEKSLEETIDLIQKRASIYVSEKYGW